MQPAEEGVEAFPGFGGAVVRQLMHPGGIAERPRAVAAVTSW